MESRAPRLRHVRGVIFWILCGLALLLIITPAVAVVISVLVKAAPGAQLEPAHQHHPERPRPRACRTPSSGTLVLCLGRGGGRRADRDPGRHLPRRVRHRTSRQRAALLLRDPRRGALDRHRLGRLHRPGGRPAWGFSILSAIFALSLLILPYIVKTTEVSFSPGAAQPARGGDRARPLADHHHPQGAAAPGAPGDHLRAGDRARHLHRRDRPAPLHRQLQPTSTPSAGLFHNPIGYLTYVTYYYVALPGAHDQALASAAAGITILLILLLIFGGRAITARQRRMVARLDV